MYVVVFHSCVLNYHLFRFVPHHFNLMIAQLLDFFLRSQVAKRVYFYKSATLVRRGIIKIRKADCDLLDLTVSERDNYCSTLVPQHRYLFNQQVKNIVLLIVPLSRSLCDDYCSNHCSTSPLSV